MEPRKHSKNYIKGDYHLEESSTLVTAEHKAPKEWPRASGDGHGSGDANDIKKITPLPMLICRKWLSLFFV